MSELINNLNEIYNVKLQLKAALETQSDVFSDYPAYVTALKPNGYTYINENGDFNVSSYEYAYIEVPTGGGSDSVIYLSEMDEYAQYNLDGMNNIVYINGNVPTYAITTQVFTQEYPTAGYLYLLTDSLGISKDNDVNAYLFEPTAMAQREYSYTDISTIDDVDASLESEAVSTNELFKARVTFRYNPNAPKIAGTMSGVAKPGPWGADGINTIMDSHAISNIYSIIETLSNKQELTTATLSSDINLTNFGSYVLIPTKDFMSKSQYKYTASNAYATIYNDPYPQEGEMYIMDMLNHKTYDCVLQRTSYKGGFTANKYETVLVDTYNYVGELQQTEIKGVRYGTGGLGGFSFITSANTYIYDISIPANGQIQARNTYFELTTDGSTWNKFNFCEDMTSASSQNYVTLKLNEHTSGGVTTYTLMPQTISNYANIPTKLPSNYFRNGYNDSLDITIKIDKDTWKVNYEFHPKDGVYMKLYDSRGQYEYIKYTNLTDSGDGEGNYWTEYNFEYDKTKGSGYTFVFVKFVNNAITEYGCANSGLAPGDDNIWEFNSQNPCSVNWTNAEGGFRFVYPTDSEVDDQGAIIVTYGDKEVAWMNIGSES